MSPCSTLQIFLNHNKCQLLIMNISKKSCKDTTILTMLIIILQGLLELLWTVYSEGKLQSCWKLRDFQNPLNKDKSVQEVYKNTMHKKRLKICTCCRVTEAKFYLCHSSKMAKAGPGFDDRLERPPVQINSSSPCLDLSFKTLV